MKSKFRFTAYLVGLGGVLLTAIMVRGLVNIILNPRDSIWIVMAVSIFFASIWAWFVFGELRTKAISVKIENRNIIVKRYLGFGASRRFGIDDISGFKTSILSSQGGNYEYLYLMT